MTNLEIMKALKAPFKPEELEWKLDRKSKDGTKGAVLCYTNSRAIMDRLDEIVGPDKWEVSYTPVDMGSTTINTRNGEKVTYVKGFMATLTLHLPEGDVTRSDGSNISDFSPFKGGLTGAFRRVATAFGIGRYLYGLEATWVPIDQYGNFTPPSLPQWALPEGYVAEAPKPKANSFEAPPQAPTTTANGEVVFPRGKYAGKPVSSVTDMGYLNWVIEKSNFDEAIKEAAKKVCYTEDDEFYEEG